MFMKVVFTLLAGLGLTYGGFANSAWLHSHVLATQASTTASTATTTSGTATSGTGAAQSATAIVGANASALLPIELQVSTGSTQTATVPVVVTAVGQGTVQIAPLSLTAWQGAGLSADTALTVPVSPAAGFSLSDLRTGMHALARVQGGVATSLEVQMRGGPHSGLKFLLGGSASAN